MTQTPLYPRLPINIWPQNNLLKLSRISGGNEHNHNNVPVLLAGGGGTKVQGGQHIRVKDETPVTNLFLSMLDRAGMRQDAIGNSNGRIERLSFQ